MANEGMKENTRERDREPWGSPRDAALSCKSVRSLSPPGGMVAYVKADYTPRDEWTLFCAFLLLTPWTRFCTLTCRWLCTPGRLARTRCTNLHTLASTGSFIRLSSRTTRTILLLTMHLSPYIFSRNLWLIKEVIDWAPSVTYNSIYFLRLWHIWFQCVAKKHQFQVSRIKAWYEWQHFIERDAIYTQIVRIPLTILVIHKLNRCDNTTVPHFSRVLSSTIW